MSEQIRPKGKIEVSSAAISSIVSEVVQRCYGVVGVVPRNFAAEVADLLSADRKRGVEIRVRNKMIVINVFVVVEYGTRIASVAQSVKNVVRYQVEKALEMPVEAVNVHVQALRVSDEE
ncbi:MAG TPA: Asp23/Gls24 family envelope stress response protein [Thermoflexia bacterium]|nr:Asp23/Gls24 family envelope stress response protein [Thermoflexia bacterium]